MKKLKLLLIILIAGWLLSGLTACADETNDTATSYSMTFNYNIAVQPFLYIDDAGYFQFAPSSKGTEYLVEEGKSLSNIRQLTAITSKDFCVKEIYLLHPDNTRTSLYEYAQGDYNHGGESFLGNYFSKHTNYPTVRMPGHNVNLHIITDTIANADNELKESSDENEEKQIPANYQSYDGTELSLIYPDEFTHTYQTSNKSHYFSSTILHISTNYSAHAARNDFDSFTKEIFINDYYPNNGMQYNYELKDIVFEKMQINDVNVAAADYEYWIAGIHTHRVEYLFFGENYLIKFMAVYPQEQYYNSTLTQEKVDAWFDTIINSIELK